MHDPVKRVVINPEVCEGCGDCSLQSNCVSIEPLKLSSRKDESISQHAIRTTHASKDFALHL